MANGAVAGRLIANGEVRAGTAVRAWDESFGLLSLVALVITVITRLGTIIGWGRLRRLRGTITTTGKVTVAAYLGLGGRPIPRRLGHHREDVASAGRARLASLGSIALAVIGVVLFPWDWPFQIIGALTALALLIAVVPDVNRWA